MPKIISAFVITLLISTSAHADGLPLKTNWQALEQLVNNSEPLKISAGEKTTYLKNDKLTLGITIDKPGYLNVISIDEKGETTLLFPNRRHPDNKVSTGNFVFPTPQMKFDLITQAPYGKALVAAFLSDHKVNMYESHVKSQSKSITVNSEAAEELFKQLSNVEVGNFEKSFGVKARKAKTTAKAGKIELMTCETAESC